MSTGSARGRQLMSSDEVDPYRTHPCALFEGVDPADSADFLALLFRAERCVKPVEISFDHWVLCRFPSAYSMVNQDGQGLDRRGCLCKPCLVSRREHSIAFLMAETRDRSWKWLRKNYGKAMITAPAMTAEA